MIKIRFFASLRERLKLDDVEIAARAGMRVHDVWSEATGLQEIDRKTLCAVNRNHQPPDCLVNDGDEVAFFPPVTGG